MTGIVKRLSTCAAFAMLLAPSTVVAGPHPVTVSAITQLSAWGQLGSSQKSADRRQESDLLANARQAMKEGKFDLAENYIRRAEQLNINHEENVLFRAFVDTPEKLRRDLNKLQQDGLVTRRLPSTRLLPPLGSNAENIPQDPFTARQLEKGSDLSQPQATQSLQPPIPNSATPFADISTPSTGDSPSAFQTSQTVNNPFNAERDSNGLNREPRVSADSVPLLQTYPRTNTPPVAASQVGGGLAESQDLLRTARLSLASGDWSRSIQLLQAANKLSVEYPLHADSPAKVQQLIDQSRTLASGPPPGADPRDYQRDFARFLMQQSTGLLQYRDYATARKLAEQAGNLQVEFGQFEQTPEMLLQEITQGERALAASASPAQDGGNPGTSGTSPATARIFDPPALPREITADGQENVGDEDLWNSKRTEVLGLLAAARTAFQQGDIQQAETLTRQAESLKVPDQVFRDGDLRPWMMRLEIGKRTQRLPAVQQAGGTQIPDNVGAAPVVGPFAVEQSIYSPERDTTRNELASADDPNRGSIAPFTDGSNTIQVGNSGPDLLQQGEQALQDGDLPAAKSLFLQAWKDESRLDSVTRERLQDHLQMLNASTEPEQIPSGQIGLPTPLESVSTEQTVLYRQLISEVAQQQRQADQLAKTYPREALEKLQAIRERVARSELTPSARKQMLTRVDISINRLTKLIEDNLVQIELDEHNRDVTAQVERERNLDTEIQNKLAVIVEDFNQLIDEQRYAEAEVLVRQARQLDPENPVTVNLSWKSKFIRRHRQDKSSGERREEGFVHGMQSIDDSAIPMDDRDPYQLPEDIRSWEILSENRRNRYLRDTQSHLNEAELEIQRRLKEPVEVRFDDRPLSEVMETLASVCGVNMFLDPEGLMAEAVTSDTRVSINLNQPVSLNSALTLILQPLRLSHVIQNEVLKITSEQTRDSSVYSQVYNVADLVIPIPNFIPNYNSMGLSGALAKAHDVGFGSTAGSRPYDMALPVMANGPAGNGNVNTSVLGQQLSSSPIGRGGSRNSQTVGFGPGGVGGGPQADFDSLIELITTTIAPTTWDEVGGPGSVEGFEGNLSLVVSQTQDVHRQVADLLEQLRRLQDLQVTIEVRFITISDDFFERIGVDFDLDIDDNTNIGDATDPNDNSGIADNGPSVTVGWDSTGMPTADLDLQFSQGSFGATAPLFGGFDPGSAANFGFAILSDIEAFFVIQALQGSTRTNIMQSPKVTLFNGQQAYVSDTTQKPFVTSIIPVVGDFAAAQQPVIVILNEGTSLSVQAVVSPDRRFVRLTLVPFFSRIGEVTEFTFTGRTSTNSGSINVDPTTGDSVQDGAQTITEGTTVQLPEFAFTTVTTTVSVPDGGTVLLGGIKRLREGRTERGVPMLNKIPYLNRLFSNTGIGRDAQSLMLMVTPRIIIQEEEEEALLGTSAP